MAKGPGINEVRRLFAAVLAREQQTLHRIELSTADVCIENGIFVFSLAGLHALLDPMGNTDIKAFRRLLYAAELNRELRAGGAEVSIFHSTGKVESNRYCLKAT